jgi:nicotinate-nucleotide pyrophosphorylase (carboxylating)
LFSGILKAEAKMTVEFNQMVWSPELIDDCRHIIRLAVREDLDRGYDWTTVSLVPREATAAAQVVAREDGVVCGVSVAKLVLDEMDIQAEFTARVADGAAVKKGDVLATLRGHARDLLTAERPILNFMGRLSGIASLTAQFVAEIKGTKARLYDTRKTIPGWRRLEKYAVHCGGGTNHRTGLFDAILIKDNHLALGRQHFAKQGAGEGGFTPAEAVRHAKAFIADQKLRRDIAQSDSPPMIVEVEVDSLEQLRQVLPETPDIVLLDNMGPPQLADAVAIRNQLAPTVELEASGGVRLKTVRGIAESGVDRISCGALTHSAIAMDVALDWVE